LLMRDLAVSCLVTRLDEFECGMLAFVSARTSPQTVVARIAQLFWYSVIN
jgi:hypothetical protein